MTFKERVLNNIKLRAGESLQQYINQSTEVILLAKSENGEEVKAIQPHKMDKGKFYFIKYNYNGNAIWCPIFSLEYKFYNQKNILYAVNLDYLPYMYKLNFFDFIWNKQKAIFEFNEVQTKMDSEKRLQDISFETIYKLLKNLGEHHFAITAYDMLKMKEVYEISYNLMDRFLFISTKNLNGKNMKELFDKELNKELKTKIGGMLSTYEKILQEYSDDSVEFYKKLKAFESQLKLTPNE